MWRARIRKLATTGPKGLPIATPSLCSWIFSSNENYEVVRKSSDNLSISSVKTVELWKTKNLSKTDIVSNFSLFDDHEKYHLFYSTPSCYIKAINEASVNLTIKTDDFFPFASDVHEYWTGYFTSRPSLKKFERLSQNILQVSKNFLFISEPFYFQQFRHFFAKIKIDWNLIRICDEKASTDLKGTEFM